MTIRKSKCLETIPFIAFVLILVSICLLISSLSLSTAQTPGSARSPVDGTLRRIIVPVLMYHYISLLPADADPFRQDLTVIPENFKAQMIYLKSQGYSSISLYEMDEALRNGHPLPAKPVVLTFDDGYSDHYTHVFPILKELGFTGTFFIITGLADQGASGYLTWQQIQEMANAGMSMEAHTKSHVDLRNRNRDFLIYEVNGSIESLNAHTGFESHFFAYPSGHYDDQTLRVLSEMPVWRAFTTVNSAVQTTSNQLESPRLRIHGNLGIQGLEQLLKHRQ